MCLKPYTFMGVGRLNIDNRRLRQIQREKRMYQGLRDKSTKENDRQIYQGKLECIEKEEREILRRCRVKI